MTEFDRLTEGNRERILLEKLRVGLISAENLEDHCLPFFVKIQIQTTSRCNGRCVTCPYPETRTRLPQGEMDEGLFHDLVGQIAGRGVERTSLFLMNEPLLDPRLEACTRYLKSQDPETTALVFTNGLLLTDERARALADAGMDEIDISVNGFDKKSHDRVMQGLSYSRIMKNLREVGTLYREGRLGTMRIKVVALSLPGNEEGAVSFREETGLEVFLKPVTNRAGMIDTKTLGGCPEQAENMKACQRPFVKAYVLFNGDMVLCNCDWMRTTLIGNLRTTSLEKLWLSPKMMEIRRAHLQCTFSENLPCSSCDYPFLI